MTEIRIPERAPADTRRLVSECERTASEADGELYGLVSGRSRVQAHKAVIQERVKFFKVREGMEASGAVAYLQGWIPAELIPDAQAAAAQHGWGIVFDEPTPGEPVPTLLHYSRWVRPIMSMFKLLGIYPGYWESDVGWTFLIFFSIFFGMLVGDAGVRYFAPDNRHRGRPEAQEGATLCVRVAVSGQCHHHHMGCSDRQLLGHPQHPRSDAGPEGRLAFQREQRDGSMFPYRSRSISLLLTFGTLWRSPAIQNTRRTRVDCHPVVHVPAGPEYGAELRSAELRHLHADRGSGGRRSASWLRPGSSRPE